ncbi:MAG: VWA domain-containing protein [Kiritimatiellia bacterium]
MKTQWHVVCAALLTATLASSVLAQNPAEARRKPVTVEGKKSLPLRVLVRPRSHIYKEAKEDSPKVQENVPAFQPFYVYTQPPASDNEQPSGWYEVGGDNRGGVIGWMRAEDVMEWKQAMCLAYTSPENREPVLMFSDRKALADLAAAPAEDRTAKVKALYATIQSKEIPAEFPVVSMEPRRAVSILNEDQFYLLPILGHKEIELDGREGRILKMAAATGKERDATTLQDTNFVKQVTAEADARNTGLKDMKIEIVYVMDLSASMQPYIDATRKLIADVSEQVGKEPGLSERVRFGLWGFRDSESIEGIEFNTKNFTPELQDATAFLQVLSGVKEAKVGSQGIPEDMFSGVDDAMRKTAWGDNTMRFIVLVGDAPGHLLGEKWNASGKDETTLRLFADDNKFNLFSILIRSKEAEKFFELAEQQFKALGVNRGTTEAAAAFSIVDSSKPEEFSGVSAGLLSGFRALAQGAAKGDVTEVIVDRPWGGEEKPAVSDATVPVEPAKPETPAEVVADASLRRDTMIRAALVDWLGEKEGSPPARHHRVGHRQGPDRSRHAGARGARADQQEPARLAAHRPAGDHGGRPARTDRRGGLLPGPAVNLGHAVGHPRADQERPQPGLHRPGAGVPARPALQEPHHEHEQRGLGRLVAGSAGRVPQRHRRQDQPLRRDP